jgi:hypothetical protein
MSSRTPHKNQKPKTAMIIRDKTTNRGRKKNKGKVGVLHLQDRGEVLHVDFIDGVVSDHDEPIRGRHCVQRLTNVYM